MGKPFDMVAKRPIPQKGGDDRDYGWKTLVGQMYRVFLMPELRFTEI